MLCGNTECSQRDARATATDCLLLTLSSYLFAPPQSWGEKGYFRLRAGLGGNGGLCGIATTASYPVKTHQNHPVPEVSLQSVICCLLQRLTPLRPIEASGWCSRWADGVDCCSCSGSWWHGLRHRQHCRLPVRLPVGPTYVPQFTHSRLNASAVVSPVMHAYCRSGACARHSCRVCCNAMHL